MSHPAALRRGITVRLVKLFLTMIVAVLNSDCCKGSLSPFPNYIIQQPLTWLPCSTQHNTCFIMWPERRRLWRILTAVHIYRSVEYSTRTVLEISAPPVFSFRAPPLEFGVKIPFRRSLINSVPRIQLMCLRLESLVVSKLVL